MTNSKSPPLDRRALLAGSLAVVGLAASTRAGRSAGPSRIVSLGGAATEILYALGASDRLAAVDLTSTFPAAAREKPNVGYYRSLSAEGVLALGPDLVVATDGAGPKEAVDVLKAAFVRFVQFEEAKDGAGVAARVRLVAEALGEPERGEALATAVRDDGAALAAALSGLPRRRKALVLLWPPRSGALISAGAGTAGGHALALAGADNGAKALTGWKPLSDEAAYAMAPEAIVLLRTTTPISVEEVSRHPALVHSPAVSEGRVIAADSLGFVGFGPRFAHAARTVAAAIYPETALAELPARAWTVDPAAAR